MLRVTDDHSHTATESHLNQTLRRPAMIQESLILLWEQTINCDWAVTLEKMLSCGGLSHWPELLQHSCIRHLPAEQLFANTARDKHASHENRWGGTNKKATKIWGNSTIFCKYQKQEAEIILTPAFIKHKSFCNLLLLGTSLSIEKQLLTSGSSEFILLFPHAFWPSNLFVVFLQLQVPGYKTLKELFRPPTKLNNFISTGLNYSVLINRKKRSNPLEINSSFISQASNRVQTSINSEMPVKTETSQMFYYFNMCRCLLE